MGTLPKLLISGVAAYIIYQWWASQAAAAPAASSSGASQLPTVTPAQATGSTGGAIQPGNTNLTPAGGVVPAAVQTVKPAITADMLAAAARQQMGSAYTGMLNADQWSWFYKNLSLLSSPDLFIAGNRGQLIDVNTYMARRAAKGLNGLGAVGPYMMLAPGAFTGRSKMATYWPWSNDPRSVKRFGDAFTMSGIGWLGASCDPGAITAAMGSN